MKLTFYMTLFLVIFQTNQAFSDDFAPIGAEWYYNSSGNGSAPTGSEYYYFKVEKDTIINNYELRKIKRTYCSYRGDSTEIEPYFIYQLGDTVSLYSQDMEKLYKLFVFNATQGDTLVLDVPPGNEFLKIETYRVVIDTIVSVQYDGVYLNKYLLKELDDYGWFTNFYLEKVGGYEWFIPLGQSIIPEAVGPIRCYHDNEVDINFSSKECDFRVIASLDKALEDRVDLFPNPARHYVNVESDLRIDEIEVLNNFGDIIFKTRATLLNIELLNNGVYFIRIKSDNDTIIKKLIKN